MRIDTNVWPGYEPIYLAREQGEYSDNEVRLVELPNAGTVIQAYRILPERRITCLKTKK
jgi:NitT/TauT family transport system substrate-binding protein